MQSVKLLSAMLHYAIRFIHSRLKLNLVLETGNTLSLFYDYILQITHDKYFARVANLTALLFSYNPLKSFVSSSG